MADKSRVLVLASGTATRGGSGFQELAEYTQTDPAVLDAEIVGVGSNHMRGGVWEKARRLGIKFTYLKSFRAEDYHDLVKYFRADFVMCSGWLLPVSGLEPAKTINIHPGLLPKFGGKGMWGHHVHEAVMVAYDRGKVTQSGVTIHFVTDYEKQKVAGVEDPYDKGPIICWFPLRIRFDDTPETLAVRVNEVERVLQSRVLNLIVHGEICMHGDHAGYTPKAKHAIAGMGGVIPNGHSRFDIPPRGPR